MDYLSVIDPVCFTGSKGNFAEGFKSRLGASDLCPLPTPRFPKLFPPPRQPPINTVEGPCVGAHHIPPITISQGATQLLFRANFTQDEGGTKKFIRPFY